MKGAFLFVGHSQTVEWQYSAQFFSQFSKSSELRKFDVLAYVNSTRVSAAQIESYLDLFPNPLKRLLYTPKNGHSIDDSLDLSCKSNLYKKDTNQNRFGYWYGVIEALAETFDLLSAYDWVIQLNPDVYITDHEPLGSYLAAHADTEFVHHVNTMRGDARNGFSTDFHIYRPRKFIRNHLVNYRLGSVAEDLRNRKQSEPEYKFIPEQILKHIVTSAGQPYRVLGPSTRNNRAIDSMGLWHCHDSEAVIKILSDYDEL